MLHQCKVFFFYHNMAVFPAYLVMDLHASASAVTFTLVSRCNTLGTNSQLTRSEMLKHFGVSSFAEIVGNNLSRRIVPAQFFQRRLLYLEGPQLGDTLLGGGHAWSAGGSFTDPGPITDKVIVFSVVHG